MQLFGRLLNRAILSHLLVAVPPAVVLGAMVIAINEQALRLESQRLHLSLATQVRDAIQHEVDVSSSLLGHAERILDLSELTIGQRKDMLRALIADGRIPYLALYRPDGAFDSVIRPKADGDIDRQSLPEATLSTARAEPLAIWDRPEATIVVRAWKRGDELLGFVATSLPQDDLRALCGQLAVRHLGDDGLVDVVAADGRYVLSSDGTHTGTPDRAATAFSMVHVRPTGDGGLTATEAAVVGDYVDASGENQLAAVVSAPRMGWMVAAARPASVAFRSLDRVRLRVALMSIIAALAAGLVGLLMARQISRPVQRLIRAVRRAAQRGFAPEAQVQASGELGQLAASFNHALAQMAEYRRQVRQTTQLRLRLSRLAPNASSARELLARASATGLAAPPEPMTVLYADVTFEQSAALETEHLVTILGEFFSAAHEAIRQEGGAVDRYSGDAVIGLFIAAALERPAEAAALSAAASLTRDAAAISERWAGLSTLRLEASVGVVSGRAQLITDDDPSRDPTVDGDLVERAAVLQRKAPAGGILVDAETRKATEREQVGGHFAARGGEGAAMWTP